MPSYIIKPDPTLDQYMIWSTIVEAPLIAGTRLDIEDYVSNNLSQVRGLAASFERADRTGTSATDGDGGYDDSVGFIYMQQGFIPRAKFTDLSYLVGDGHQRYDATPLIIPFEDD